MPCKLCHKQYANYMCIALSEESLAKVYPESDRCLCPDDVVIYECTVVGGSSTVWEGSTLDDLCRKSGHELILIHKHYSSSEGIQKSCSNGSIMGRSVMISVENNTYISQLIVNLTSNNNLIGSSIECIRDDGFNTTSVGSLNITACKCIHYNFFILT